MWTYRQSTGALLHEGTQVATGYSGNGECKNCCDKQDVQQHGPIPQGHYTIGPSFKDPHKGPIVMHLIPDPANQMFGRSGFLIHGDAIADPGSASEGCIILGPAMRTKIAASPDRTLEVIA